MKSYQWLPVSVLAFVLGASAMGLSARISAERNLSIREVPDAVRDTIIAEVLHECFDLEIARDEEVEGIVFEVEFEHGEIEVELEISSTGEVLEKEVVHQDEDDDDEDIDNDDDEDDEDDDHDDV